MPAKSERPLARLCVRIFEDDDRALEDAAALGQISKNRLIRTILHSYVTNLSDLTRRKIDAGPLLPAVSIDIGQATDDPEAESEADSASSGPIEISLDDETEELVPEGEQG